MEELKKKLQEDIDQSDWSMLKPHVERGAILFVDRKLELVDVGVAIAQDKIQIVKLWLDEGLVTKPTQTEIDDFEKDEYTKKFKFLIIQPYVLVQVYKPDELS